MIKKLPHIFIFDIDQCILGEVRYILGDFNIYEHIDNLYPGYKYDYQTEYVSDLHKGLLRPYFKEFIDFINKKYENCEIYLYSNGSYSWVNGVVGPLIEKAAGINFNKPYFTRENSLSHEKSLSKVYKIIFKGLKDKYDNDLLEKNYDNIINNRLVFIDNLKDNTTTHKTRQIKCPDYENIIYRDVYAIMLKIYGKDILNTDIVKRFFEMNKINYKNEDVNDIINSDVLYYNATKNRTVRYCELMNIKSKQDIFFKVLIQKLSGLTDAKIAQINKLFII